MAEHWTQTAVSKTTVSLRRATCCKCFCLVPCWITSKKSTIVARTFHFRGTRDDNAPASIEDAHSGFCL